MELYIDENFKGIVKRYYQDRELKRWCFEFIAEKGIIRSISIPFDNIKRFTSIDGLKITMQYDNIFKGD